MTHLIDEARKLREILVRDRWRPTYHITAPEGVNSPFDPNAALFWKGHYHLMYIVQRDASAKTEVESCHSWAHISSTDLVHWRHHPLALEPGGIDTGIFSGGVFVDKAGVPTITYWGLGEKAGICMATSADEHLDHWTKSSHNPVIQQSEQGFSVGADGRPYGVADPSAIWIHDDRYYLLTGNLLVLRRFGLEGNQQEHKGDTTYLFVSDDLIHWKYLHPFYQSDRAWTGEDEDNMCPDFFPLGDRHMLLFISHNRGCQYYIGRYEDDRFYPEKHGRLSWVDGAFFAPESLLDDQGRRIMWAWIRDGREDCTRQASLWSGTMSLPRVLWLGEDGTLRMAPPRELAALRHAAKKMVDVTVQPGGELPLTDVWGDTIELSIEMNSDVARQFGVMVCCSPDGEERTPIYYDVVEKTLNIDTRRSSSGEGPKSIEGGPLELEPGESLRLRVFVDRSVVEVFANERQAVMRRIYPTRRDSLAVIPYSRGGITRVASLEAWDIAAANPW
jgi:beta-fructofuranosidase